MQYVQERLTNQQRISTILHIGHDGFAFYSASNALARIQQMSCCIAHK